jgi:hypothetical protein
MASIRSDRARARARDFLETTYPVPDEPEVNRLRELAVEYIREAERLEAENRGRVAEADELISAALDAVARDYFSRALVRALSHGVRDLTGPSNGPAENPAPVIPSSESRRRID